MKVFTTAIFSVALLGRKLSVTKWVSLVILFIGVSMVTVDPSSIGKDKKNHYFILGVAAVAISCLSSGFASVYFEKILKGSSASVWLRNVQLGFFGSIAAITGMFAYDYQEITEKGFFFGYNSLVWLVIIQQAIGGLIVAVVVRYADNILKGFATSISIIVSALSSVYLFEFTLTTMFGIGTILVVTSIYLYALPNKASDDSSAPALPLKHKKLPS